MRKHYTATFKAESVQEVLRGDKLITQIASTHEIHPNLIGEWKADALKGLPSLFEKEHSELTSALFEWLVVCRLIVVVEVVAFGC